MSVPQSTWTSGKVTPSGHGPNWKFRGGPAAPADSVSAAATTAARTANLTIRPPTSTARIFRCRVRCNDCYETAIGAGNRAFRLLALGGLVTLEPRPAGCVVFVHGTFHDRQTAAFTEEANGLAARNQRIEAFRHFVDHGVRIPSDRGGNLGITRLLSGVHQWEGRRGNSRARVEAKDTSADGLFGPFETGARPTVSARTQTTPALSVLLGKSGAGRFGKERKRASLRRLPGGQAVVIVRARIRLFRLALLAAVLCAVCVATSAAGASPPPTCTFGVSSVGPVVLINGQLAVDQSDLTPATEACLQK